MERLMSAARRYPALAAALGLGATIRLLAWIAYPPALLFHADSYAYLRGALELLPATYRPSLYSLFILPLVHWPGIIAVTAIQHLMGIAMGMAIFVLLRRLGVGVLGATLGTLPLLLDGYQINIEQHLLSETLFQALVLGALLLLVWSRPPPLTAVLAAGVLLGMSAVTRTIGLVTIIPAVVYAARRAGWIRAGVLVGAFTVPIALYAAWFHASYGVWALTERNGSFLYGRVAPFARCETVALPSYERVLCDPRPVQERPGPNYYIWWDDSPAERLRPPEGVTEEAALTDFALRVIAAQPEDYMRTILGDLAHYIAPGRWTNIRDARLAVYRFPVDTSDAAPLAGVVRQFGAAPPPADFKARPQGPQQPSIVRPLATVLRTYQKAAYTPGPVLALMLLLGVVGAVLAPAAATGGRGEILLFASIAIAFPVVAAATSLFDYRYILPSVPPLVLAGSLGGSVLYRRWSPVPKSLEGGTITRSRLGVGAAGAAAVAAAGFLNLAGNGSDRARAVGAERQTRSTPGAPATLSPGGAASPSGSFSPSGSGAPDNGKQGILSPAPARTLRDKVRRP